MACTPGTRWQTRWPRQQEAAQQRIGRIATIVGSGCATLGSKLLLLAGRASGGPATRRRIRAGPRTQPTERLPNLCPGCLCPQDLDTRNGVTRRSRKHRHQIMRLHSVYSFNMCTDAGASVGARQCDWN